MSWMPIDHATQGCFMLMLCSEQNVATNYLMLRLYRYP